MWFNFKKQIESAVQKYIADSIVLVAEPGMTDADVESMTEGPREEFFETVVYLASRMKDHAFVEENETRVICRCNETFYSDSPSLGLIPRTSFGFSPESIQEIIVGPGVYADARLVSIERFLHRHQLNYRHVIVTPSKIPYREL